MLFSQRLGITSVKKIIQKDSIDNDLRNSLWNTLYNSFFYKVISKTSQLSYYVNYQVQFLIRILWVDYFKLHLDNLPSPWDGNKLYGKKEWNYIFKVIKDYFFKCEWYKVYDFIDFIANNNAQEYEIITLGFIKECNEVLEREVSAYRFISKKLAPITSETEIAEIDEALESTDNLKPVNDHLKKALDFLADRQSPDYNNSIKESISTVESICSLIAGIKKAKLGDALDKIKKEEKVKIHPALESAFDSLFGYTSDEGGIRHAKIKKSNVDFEEAKFMLVSCSAFINYLILKCEKAGIKL